MAFRIAKKVQTKQQLLTGNANRTFADFLHILNIKKSAWKRSLLPTNVKSNIYSIFYITILGKEG